MTTTVHTDAFAALAAAEALSSAILAKREALPDMALEATNTLVALTCDALEIRRDEFDRYTDFAEIVGDEEVALCREMLELDAPARGPLDVVITNKAQATNFLRWLAIAGYIYHPDDCASDCLSKTDLSTADKLRVGSRMIEAMNQVDVYHELLRAQVPSQADRVFHCVWSEDYADQNRDGRRYFSFFTLDNGYETEDIEAIGNLEPGHAHTVWGMGGEWCHVVRTK